MDAAYNNQIPRRTRDPISNDIQLPRRTKDATNNDTQLPRRTLNDVEMQRKTAIRIPLPHRMRNDVKMQQTPQHTATTGIEFSVLP